MWTDNETTSDLIGFRVHADLIRSVISDPGMSPVTIGVFGDWGGGKTSIMRMLEQDLDPERQNDPTEKARYERIACLYFNGWLFEGYDDAKAALLSAVLVALAEHKRFGPKVRAKAVSLLKSVNWMRVVRLGLKEVAVPAIAAYATGGVSLVPSAASVFGRFSGALFTTASDSGEASKEDTPASAKNKKEIDWEALIRQDPEPASPLDVRSFRDRFEALLKESDIDTLVVLIDDLDRCSPERIIDNLEAIKLFLNVPRTAFVIGADPRIVRHAIASRYRTGEVIDRAETEEAQERLVTDYLEKLIQVPYWLPRLSPAEIETYMTLLFCHQHLKTEDWEACVIASEAQRSANRYAVFGYAAVKEAVGTSAIKPALADNLAFSASSAQLITEGLKGNPRQVKRFLNAFALRKKLAVIAHLTNIRDDVLVKLMILEYAQARAFRQLFEWQAAQDGNPVELRAMESTLRDETEKGSKATGTGDLPWSSDFLHRWIRIGPALGDVDLRDYFWVARDRLASTFSGLSLVPPVVRRAFEDLLSENPGRRSAALTAIAGMDGNQGANLLELLGAQLVRNPDAKASYDAFRAVIEKNIPDATDVFVETIMKIPASRVPAAVGLDLRTLIKTRTDLGARIQPVLDAWEESNTVVGRALRPVRPRRRD